MLATTTEFGWDRFENDELTEALAARGITCRRRRNVHGFDGFKFREGCDLPSAKHPASARAKFAALGPSLRNTSEISTSNASSRTFAELTGRSSLKGLQND
jgi:hypothetical protein